MSVLESVLYACKAEQYINSFKEQKIEAPALKLLNDEDLQLLGIEEEEKRASILQHAKNLIIPSEQPIDILIDEKYILTVLSQMSIHLNKHLAALSIAANREDVIVCDVRLSLAARCLKNCLESLSKQLHQFDEKVTIKQPKKRNYKKLVPPITLLAFVGLASFKFIQYV